MMRLAGIWVKSKAVPSQAGPSVKRGLKGPATISNSQSMVSPPASQILYSPPSTAGKHHGPIPVEPLAGRDRPAYTAIGIGEGKFKFTVKSPTGEVGSCKDFERSEHAVKK